MLYIKHLGLVGAFRFAEAEAQQWVILKSNLFSVTYWPKTIDQGHSE